VRKHAGHFLKGKEMERSVAIKKLTKLLGKTLMWRINPKAATPEEREAAKAAFPEASAEAKRLKELREARYAAVLEADVEYQSLKTQAKAASDHASRLSGIMFSRKITVGVNNGLFFHVKAEGDSWEDVIQKLTAKKETA
jgi:hypothetical protein